MDETSPLLGSSQKEFRRLVLFLKPASDDPTYLVLKAHLLAEEVLIRFIEHQAYRSKFISETRFNFVQLIALSRSFNRRSADDWWGWVALEKLNSLRNLLAHNLEPKNLREKIVDFSIFVADSIGATKDSEIGREYGRLANSGVHPFILALIATHIAVCATLDLDAETRWAALQ